MDELAAISADGAAVARRGGANMNVAGAAA